MQLVGRCAADAQHEAAVARGRTFDRRTQDHRAAGVLEIALERQHEGVAVDDAGDGREQRRLAPECRLELARLGTAQPAQAAHAVRGRASLDRLQRLDLRRRRRDDELAAAAMADAARLAIGIERFAAGDAEGRLERPGSVVEAGMDDLAVARAGAVADAGAGLEHDRLPAAQRQLARHRQADGACPHHHRVDALHPGSSACDEAVSAKVGRPRCHIAPTATSSARASAAASTCCPSRDRRERCSTPRSWSARAPTEPPRAVSRSPLPDARAARPRAGFRPGA